MTLPEIEAKIAEAEKDWRMIADPELKRVAEDICKDLYAQKEMLLKATKNRN